MTLLSIIFINIFISLYLYIVIFIYRYIYISLYLYIVIFIFTNQFSIHDIKVVFHALLITVSCSDNAKKPIAPKPMLLGQTKMTR